MKFILTILLLLSMTATFSQTGETITNQTIIQLRKAGLGKEVLINKIQTSVCNFDLSTNSLIALKKENIPDDVISAMMTKSSTPVSISPTQDNTATTATGIPPSSGIYYFDSTANKYVEFDPSVLSNQKSGGFSEALKRSVTTLFNAKKRASISGAEANIKFYGTKPQFLFVFDTTAGGFSNSNSIWSTVQSPNEFFLVKLTVVKNSREVVVGKENNWKSDVGVDDELKVPFTTKKIRRGVYEVTPTTTLQAGEYCFMFAASSMYAGQTHKVYDFSVK